MICITERKITFGDLFRQMLMADNNVLYRAQVAVEDRENTKLPPNCITPKLVRCGSFSVERPEDNEVFIAEITIVSDKVIVSDLKNSNLKVFDMNGNFLSSVPSKQFVWGITNVDDKTFATCGEDKRLDVWTLYGKSVFREIAPCDLHLDSFNVHFNGRFYCVLHCYDTVISVLDTELKLVRKIVRNKAFDREIEFGFGIQMDSKTNNIYVSCVGYHSGVLCLSEEGEPLWFTPLSGKPWGIAEINGILCVADAQEQCFHLISKTGEYKGKLLDEDTLVDQPICICFDKNSKKLFVSFDKKDTILVYQMEI